MKYKISQYAKLEKVQYRTIWNRIQRGELHTERTTTGRILVVVDEVQSQKVAVYCRVSSSENKAHLERQKERVLSYCYARGYHVEKVVCEIGSGLNDKRKKLGSLLLDPSITKIVVEHSDRLCRFGSGYVVMLLGMQGRSIEIMNQMTNDRDDLMQDFVSIITSFTARLYGKRPNKRRTEQFIQALENEKGV